MKRPETSGVWIGVKPEPADLQSSAAMRLAIATIDKLTSDECEQLVELLKGKVKKRGPGRPAIPEYRVTARMWMREFQAARVNDLRKAHPKMTVAKALAAVGECTMTITIADPKHPLYGKVIEIPAPSPDSDEFRKYYRRESGHSRKIKKLVLKNA